MPRTEPYHSAKLAALLSDGDIVDVVVHNFGWDQGSYITKWQFDGLEVVTRFPAAFYSYEFCPHPDVRAAFDYEQIEAAIEKHYGCKLEDIEEF